MTAVARSSIETGETSDGSEDPFEGPYEQPGVPAGGPATEINDSSADADDAGDSDGDDVVTGRTPDGARYESPPPQKKALFPRIFPAHRATISLLNNCGKPLWPSKTRT